MIRSGIAIITFSVVLLSACSSGGDSDSSLACNHFRNIASDYNARILTGTELRGKLQEVNENASIATPDIRSAATAMLAGATAGNDSSLAAAVTRMDAACKAAGH